MRKQPLWKLKALRVEHNIKQEYMARILGIGKSTYNRKENGKAQFTEEEIRKICTFFGKDPKDIFFYDVFEKQKTESTA